MNYDLLVSAVRVSIPSYKESKTQSGTVFFCIQCESKDNKWFVEKRFSEFDTLLKALKGTFHSLPELPAKNFLFKLTEKDLQARRKALQTFLQKIVIRNDLMNFDAVKSFLQLDKNASEIMVNPPKLLFEYSIEGQTKGVRDYVYLPEENMFIIVTADMSPMSRFNAKVSNTKLPWDNQQKSKTFMEVGSVEGWVRSENSSNWIKKWAKSYPTQAISVSYDPGSNRVLVGFDDGVVDMIVLTKQSYEDVVCVKIHQGRVNGISYDSLYNIVYSVSQDKTFRVSHGSSLSLIVAVPHKQQLLSLINDRINKRIFIGTKNGQVHLYSIATAQKPKIIIVLSNNKKGAIRAMSLDINRNYLFTGSYDDGQINVFDLDKPGRQKYAKLNATIQGKEKARSITWSAKRVQIMVGGADGNITFWDAVQGKPIYMLEAFDNEITQIQYLQQKQYMITASKGKTIKVWTLPKEWRDAKVVAQQIKMAGKRVNEYNKEKVFNAVKKAEQDSDDDDLAGWHLD